MFNYCKEAFNVTIKKKSIPSLDGLRAVSVLLVVAGHFVLNSQAFQTHISPYLVHKHLSLSQFFIYQDLGVSIFFVISGFLITNILINDVKKYGAVRLKEFFLKRLFRIFPAYYFFLIVTYFVLQQYSVNFRPEDLLSGFLYLGYYYPHHTLATWGHSWSLAVEEQFYLLWAPILKLLTARNVVYLIIIIILVSPILRVITYFGTDIYKHKYPFLIHTRADTLMFGCLMSYSLDSGKLKNLFSCFKKKWFGLISALFLFLIYPILHMYFLGKYRATIGYSIEGFFISGFIYHMIKNEQSFYGRILNSRLFIHIGSISYGIYLWQQPFFYVKELSHFGITLTALLVYFCAMISHFIIEFPLLKLRSRFIV